MWGQLRIGCPRISIPQFEERARVVEPDNCPPCNIVDLVEKSIGRPLINVKSAIAGVRRVLDPNKCDQWCRSRNMKSAYIVVIIAVSKVVILSSHNSSPLGLPYVQNTVWTFRAAILVLRSSLEHWGTDGPAVILRLCVNSYRAHCHRTYHELLNCRPFTLLSRPAQHAEIH